MEIESLFFFFISKIHPKPAVYFESLRKTERVSSRANIVCLRDYFIHCADIRHTAQNNFAEGIGILPVLGRLYFLKNTWGINVLS